MTNRRRASLEVRSVPFITALSGMMLLRLPAWICGTVNTDASDTSNWRLWMVCSAVTIWLPMTIGSIPTLGQASCVWRPVTLMVMVSDPAV